METRKYKTSYGSFEIGNISVNVDKIISDLTEIPTHLIDLYLPNIVSTRKTLATVFLTQSVRTRLTFEKAAYQLGYQVINVTERRDGEPLRDLGFLVSQVADVIVVRLQDDGDFEEFCRNIDASKCKVIDAGAGKSRHPTQAIIDVFTLYQANISKGRLIATFGPNTNRAMNSFIELASREYTVENWYKADIYQISAVYCVTFGHDATLPTSLIGKRMPGGMSIKILHPFPRGNVIPSVYDFTDNDLYHKQMENAVAVRRTILSHI